jgi:hypothetical protein
VIGGRRSRGFGVDRGAGWEPVAARVPVQPPVTVNGEGDDRPSAEQA